MSNLNEKDSRIDISETRRCPHHKRCDDYCPDCEILDRDQEIERLTAENKCLNDDLDFSCVHAVEMSAEIDTLTAEIGRYRAVIEAAQIWERDENRTDETEHNLIMAVQALSAGEGRETLNKDDTIQVLPYESDAETKGKPVDRGRSDG
jgi:hypothetical protein